MLKDRFPDEEDTIQNLHSNKDTLKNKSLIYYVKCNLSHADNYSNLQHVDAESIDDYVYFDCPDTRDKLY